MNEEILINITPQETRVALIQQGAVQELQIERTRQRGIVGNIYLAKVVRVLPGMQSAFIEIGLERTAFMHVADITQNNPQAQIEKLLFEGQNVLVQVLKDPLGTKGARLTTQLSIAGRNLVYLPPAGTDVAAEKYIGVSQRIDQPEEREAIKARLAGLMPADEKGGIIVRTSAQDASDTELEHDMHYLRTTWERIREAVNHKPAPSLLYQDLSLAERVLRDVAGEGTTQIRVDSAENFEKLKSFATLYMPNLLDKLTLHRGERALFDLFDVDSEINKALGRRVDLKSGGYLMIDQTESMTTIDVNTGSYVGARNLDDTVFKTNLEAAQSIARQLRLRNLGGIIIIDFIDMLSKDHQDSVLNELKRNLERDHARTSISEFSSLGLVEMTRKRTRESLAHITCEPCPTCQGKGEVKTAQTICYEILREIVREHRQFNPREFRIVAAPDVIDLFLEEENQFLAQLGDFINKPIKLQAESSFRQEQYDIVLS
ncbi:ribonuclease G [Polynucleobacter sp. es-EL-1]|uniref:ribonuclease G n=1 Tax=Polynucleobacter sp. es-EL-1 TaxID=1855652 RepID=UPI001BFD126D|nr:ribonuclease G [Polynucleobacter sp. es-EL-1]QWE10980.1 ribonuclease G [Polynucleobacter sp. es-EL-1]